MGSEGSSSTGKGLDWVVRQAREYQAGPDRAAEQEQLLGGFLEELRSNEVSNLLSDSSQRAWVTRYLEEVRPYAEVPRLLRWLYRKPSTEAISFLSVFEAGYRGRIAGMGRTRKSGDRLRKTLEQFEGLDFSSLGESDLEAVSSWRSSLVRRLNLFEAKLAETQSQQALYQEVESVLRRL